MNHFSITIHPRGDEYQVDLDDEGNVASATRFLPNGERLDYHTAREIPPVHLVQIEKRAELERKKEAARNS